jgi:TRAP-type C4-dicarboxylate transport system substrate-binding protein
MKRAQWWVFFVAVGVFFLLVDAPRPGAQTGQAPVTLKAVTAWTKAWPFNDMYFEWIKRVNERAGGRLKIEYIGGPEVYPALEQLDPLKRRVVDSIVTSTGYVAGALPEVNATWLGFGASPAELRAAGLADMLDKIAREKAGVTLLGFPLQVRFNVYLNKPIEKADLRGFKLRSVAVYDPVLKGLGASTVTLPPAEVLPALQTGVVDGFAWPANFVVKPGFARVIKYKVMPHWWIGTDIALMNAQAFDSLPADLRKLLIDTMKEVERDTPAHFLKLEKEEDAALLKAGVKVIELPAAEVGKVNRVQWEEGSQAFLLGPSPKYGAQLRELLSRFAPR